MKKKREGGGEKRKKKSNFKLGRKKVFNEKNLKIMKL